MNTDPSVIRRLKLSLPVAFDIDQSDEKSIAIADKIRFSPRFFESSGDAFSIKIIGGEVPMICLLGLQKEKISCVSGFTIQKSQNRGGKRLLEGQKEKLETDEEKTQRQNLIYKKQIAVCH